MRVGCVPLLSGTAQLRTCFIKALIIVMPLNSLYTSPRNFNQKFDGLAAARQHRGRSPRTCRLGLAQGEAMRLIPTEEQFKEQVA